MTLTVRFMMKYLNSTLFSLLLGVSTSVSAHSLWTVGENKDVLEADLVYGHHFPEPEVIPEARLGLFNPTILVSDHGTETLTQSGQNYHYRSKGKLAKGTYVLIGSYKPTYWTKKADGEWAMGKTRADFPNAQRCELYSMQGKSFVRVDDDGAFATQPVGKGYEITPLVKPDEIKAGEVVRFRLTHDGKPVADAVVVGSPAGFNAEMTHEDEESELEAFHAVTNEKGEFPFKALKPGFWYLESRVEHKGDPKVCEKITDQLTLNFHVK